MDALDHFGVDSPCTSIEDDKLGLSTYAERIAKSIHNLSITESYTISINAPWGAGKTSFCNFILSYINELDKEADKYIVVRFDPWIYTTAEDIIRSFIAEVFNHISMLEEVKGYLASSQKILKGVQELVESIEGTPFLVKAAFKAATFDWQSLKLPTLIDIFKNLSNAIEKSEKRIIIVIDDIDRLQPDECQMILTMVKTVGNLPRSIYLLLFDIDIVSRMVKSYNPSVSGLFHSNRERSMLQD